MLYRPAGVERDSRRLHQALPLRVSQEEVRGLTRLGGAFLGGPKGGEGIGVLVVLAAMVVVV